jgi:hypothetical protein
MHAQKALLVSLLGADWTAKKVKRAGFIPAPTGQMRGFSSTNVL